VRGAPFVSGAATAGADDIVGSARLPLAASFLARRCCFGATGCGAAAAVACRGAAVTFVGVGEADSARGVARLRVGFVGCDAATDGASCGWGAAMVGGVAPDVRRVFAGVFAGDLLCGVATLGAVAAVRVGCVVGVVCFREAPALGLLGASAGVGAAATAVARAERFALGVVGTAEVAAGAVGAIVGAGALADGGMTLALRRVAADGAGVGAGCMAGAPVVNCAVGSARARRARGRRVEDGAAWSVGAALTLGVVSSSSAMYSGARVGCSPAAIPTRK